MHRTAEFIILLIYLLDALNGKLVKAQLNHEAHLVSDLKANLLIGSDILTPKGIVLDFSLKRMTILSCCGMTMDINVHA